jgi:hypothetical protein
MTVWRDVLLLVWQVQERLGQRQVRCLGVDGFWVRLRGQGRGLVVAVEMEEGLPLALLQVDERDPKALTRALAPLLERLGVEVLVTDDLPSYHLLAEEVGLRQQVCTFHLMRWASREVRRLEREVGPEGAPVLAQVRDILRERPLDGGRRLFPLWLELSQGPSQAPEPPGEAQGPGAAPRGGLGEATVCIAGTRRCPPPTTAPSRP